jgi:hypothetical protein
MLGAATLVLCACSLPLVDKAVIARAKDSTAPVIVLAAPTEGSSCANVVEVKGSVSDKDNSGGAGGVASLDYEILGTTQGGSVKLAADGSFDFLFDASTVGTRFSLVVKAVDWNGNAASQSVSLTRDSASSIPSLAVSSGNKAVTLTWDAVPQTESYDLMYSTNGSLPSAANGTTLQGVSSPCVVDNLPNGSLCVFRLVANPKAGWTGSSSDYAMSIPLSPRSLVPQVKGEVGQLRVRWPAIAATSDFELQRRTGATGYFVKLGLVHGTEFVDTGLTEGVDYYYRLRPSAYSDTLSEANAARLALDEQYPSFKASFATGNTSYDMATSTNYAYVAQGKAGMSVFDITDPLNPSLRATVPLPPGGTTNMNTWTEAWTVSIAGNWLCLAGNDALMIYDIASPASPVFKRAVAMNKPYPTAPGGWAVSNAAVDSVIQGNYAYVSCGEQGVQTVNLGSGAVLQNLDYGQNVNNDAIAICNGYLVVQAFSYNASDNSLSRSVLRIYSINSGSGLLTLVKTFTLPCNEAGQAAFAVSGTNLLVGLGQHLFNISMAAPSSPTMVLDQSFPPVATALVVDGSRILAFGTSDITMTFMAYEYDISVPATPRKIMSFEVAGDGRSGLIRNSALLIASGSAGLQLYSDPRYYCKQRGFLPLGSWGFWSPMDIDIQGQRCALVGQDMSGSGGGYFALYDIADPDNPRELCRLPTAGVPRNVVYSGDHAYIADESAGLSIIDLEDPSTPKLLKSVPVTGRAQGVTVYGDRAYVTDGSSQLRAVDISDPANAVLLSDSVRLGDKCSASITLDGSMAYTPAGGSIAGLQCIDLSRPGDGAVSIPSISSCVGIAGSYAYGNSWTAGSVGLTITNVSDPLKASRLSLAPYASAYSGGTPVVSGGYAYVAASNLGALRFYVGDAANPVYLLTARTSSLVTSIEDVAVSGSLMAVATAIWPTGEGIQLWSLAP